MICRISIEFYKNGESNENRNRFIDSKILYKVSVASYSPIT